MYCIVLHSHPDSNQHQNLLTSRKSFLAHAHQVWPTSIDAFVSWAYLHKCLNGRAPGYLADDFRLAGRGRPGSRSAASMTLDIPHMPTSLGDRAFAVAGPRV